MPDHYYTSFRPHVKDFAEAYCPVCQKTNRICHILPDLAASETLYFGDRYYKDRNNPVYIPRDTRSDNAVYRLGSAYRNWSPDELGYDIDETKGRISSFKTTAGKMMDIRKSSRDVAVSRVDRLLGSWTADPRPSEQEWRWAGARRFMIIRKETFRKDHQNKYRILRQYGTRR